MGEGECSAAPTNSVTTPFSAAAKAWGVASEIPITANPWAGSGPMGYLLPPGLTRPPDMRGDPSTRYG